MAPDLSADIAAVQGIAAVPRILEVVCRSTGMGFAAVARVTEQRWICCAVRDEIAFVASESGPRDWAPLARLMLRRSTAVMGAGSWVQV